MTLRARSLSFACWTVLCLLAIGAWPATTESDRVTIEGLVSAAPVPPGFVVTRQDAEDGGKVVGHYLILTKEDSPTRALVQIERREIKEQAGRVATLKAYVNAAAATWRKQGYSLKARAVPDFETIDFAKPVSVDLDATKEGENPLQIHMEVFFDTFAYQVMCMSSDATEANGMVEWCKSVRPAVAESATRPAN